MSAGAGGSVVVIGGTAGLGLAMAARYAAQGRAVVISGRDADRAAAVAATVEGEVRGIGLDLARPTALAERLRGIGAVAQLVLAAIERDHNTVRDYDIDRALRLVTLKLVGYTAVVHALASRLADTSSILVFGGLALLRPYRGSTTLSTVNGAMIGLVHTLAVELAPVRVNGLHPGIVGDSPEWSGRTEELERVRARTPIGRTVTMDDVADAGCFLLDNPSVNGVNLVVDGGWLLR